MFKIAPVESSIKFDVKASVAIKGIFEKWDATLTFASADVSSGVLDIKIQADSVDTGSGMKNRFLFVTESAASEPKPYRLLRGPLKLRLQ